MPAPANLSFEDSSGTADGGGALGWTLTTSGDALDWALFGASLQGYESFERGWDDNENYVFAFTTPLLAVAAYAAIIGTPVDYEDFERGWSANESYVTAFTEELLSAAEWGSVPDAFESFSVGWDVAPYWTSWADLGGSVDTAEFNTGLDAFENFEWGASSYVSAFAGLGVDLEGATYRGGLAESAETFANARPVTAASADAGTGAFTAPAHAFVDTDAVTIDGGAPPAPLAKLVTYYVRDATMNTFKLAATSGGAALVLIDGGSADLTVTGDPATYWTARMTTI